MVDLYSEVLRIRLTVKCNLVTEGALGGRGFVQFVCLNYHCSIQIKLNAPKGHFANYLFCKERYNIYILHYKTCIKILIL
jgi:hypothetical protein